jgi:hypothetical protein
MLTSFMVAQGLFYAIIFILNLPSLIPPAVVYENVDTDDQHSRASRNTLEEIQQDPKMELLAFAKERNMEDLRTVVCLRQSGLAPAGGIETWFWTMAKYVFSVEPLNLYSLNLVRPHWIHGWFYGWESLIQVLNHHIKLNLDDRGILILLLLIHFCLSSPFLHSHSPFSHYHTITSPHTCGYWEGRVGVKRVGVKREREWIEGE